MPSPGNTQLVYGCASKDSLAPAVQSRWGIKQGLLRRVVGLCRSEMTTNFSGFVCEFYLCQGCSWKAHDLINTWLMAFGKKKNVWLVNMRLEGLDIWAVAFDDSPLIVESYAPIVSAVTWSSVPNLYLKSLFTPTTKGGYKFAKFQWTTV